MRRLTGVVVREILQVTPASVLRRLGHDFIAPCYHVVSHQPLPHIKALYTYRNPRQFENDLDILLKHYQPVSLDELVRAVRSNVSLPAHTLFLSFDDGFREMADVVAPICRAKGVPATFFLTTAFLDNRVLGFRNKASILAEHCLAPGRERARQIVAAWARESRYADPGEDICSYFCSFRYHQATALDACADRLGIDFTAYLETERPYLTREQVSGLRRAGFAIGCHSVDHPLYADLTLKQQLDQTRASIRDLQSSFGVDIRTFAFPFVSDGVSQEFYDEAIREQLIDVFFCIGQMPVQGSSLAVQRFGIEARQYIPIRQLITSYQRRAAEARFRAMLPIHKDQLHR